MTDWQPPPPPDGPPGPPPPQQGPVPPAPGGYPPPPGGYPPPPGGYPPPPGAGAPGGFAPPPGGGYAPPPGYGAPGYGYAPQGGGYGGPPFAGFGARLGALLIDGVIAVIPIGIGLVLLAASSSNEPCTNDFGEPSTCSDVAGWAVALMVLLALVALAFGIWNQIFRQGRTGQTIGKKTLGISTVDKATGRPIGPGRAFVRYLVASIASGSFCALGYLWMLWDPEKQTWHDKVASSYVITV